jgi:hypothetical protein
MYMLVLTVGPDLDPVEAVLREFQPARVLMFHLPDHQRLPEMKDQLRNAFGITHLTCEELPYPSDEGLRGERLRSMFHSLKAFENTAAKSDTVRVCVSGGTKWMGHALHQVAFSLGLDIILTSHPRFENVDEIITLPSTHRAIQTAKRLDAMRTGTWVQFLRLLYAESPHSMARAELSEQLSVQRQTIEHMYNGRQSGSDISAKGLNGIGVVEEVIVQTGGKGAPRKNLRLTPFGEEVVRNL